MENKNIKNERDIYANASNFDIKIENDEDIKTGRRGRRPLQIPTQKYLKIKEYNTYECKNKIFDKYKSNVVGADASVRLRKDQNKDNIKIFERIKSDAVGVGVLDDPLIKQKHTNKPLSNNPTSNIKIPTSNAAITLIALIITIIVLLILAGVTLNMVMGENGIFGKANNAKDKTEVAQYEEELRICVLELQADAAANGTTFNMDTIKENFTQKVNELENTTEIEFPTEESETRLDGTYKGYEFYIDDKYAAHIGDKATGISLTTNLEPKGWTQGPVTATITIKSNNGINNVEPDEGSKNGNEYIITKENIAENTSFKYTVTDGQGNTQTKTAVINTIDKNPPADFTITAENTEEGLRITGETTDAESGIDKYEYYAKKSDDEYKKYESNPITGLAKGTYDIKVIAYDKAGNSKVAELKSFEVKKEVKRTKISAQDIKNNPEGYYGQTVDYTSSNGQNNWKIFYSDGIHIFLITGEYIDLSDTDRLDLNTGMKIFSSSKYRANWEKIPDFQTIDSEVLERFKATGSNINEYQDEDNSKCVSTLLNTNNWKKYMDNENCSGRAEYSVGAPTIEMWMNSWNNKYPKEKFYWKKSNEKDHYGYCVGTSENPNEYRINSWLISSYEGINDKLYFPYDSVYNNMYRYATASPSADVSNSILHIQSDGKPDINNGQVTNDPYIALRPVVSLKDNVTVDIKD